MFSNGPLASPSYNYSELSRIPQCDRAAGARQKKHRPALGRAMRIQMI
jgi:hypothetical protein